MGEGGEGGDDILRFHVSIIIEMSPHVKPRVAPIYRPSLSPSAGVARKPLTVIHTPMHSSQIPTGSIMSIAVPET